MVGWTSTFLQVLGIQPFVGRDFEPEDETPIDPKVLLDPKTKLFPGYLLLTSMRCGKGSKKADPRVRGRTIQMDGRACFIIEIERK